MSVIPALSALYFVVIVVYGVVFLNESVTLAQVSGILLAIAAVLLLTW